MKFFLDANMPYSVLTIFKELGLKAIHARDVGLSRAADKEIARYAKKNKSILVQFIFSWEAWCQIMAKI